MNVRWGQGLLILALAFLVIYVFRLRTVLRDRVIYLVLAVIGIILVLNPDLSSEVAHLLGIGRGTDLLLYLFVITGFFYSVGVTAELKRIRRQLTLIEREMALAHPEQGHSGPSGTGHPAQDGRPPDS